MLWLVIGVALALWFVLLFSYGFLACLPTRSARRRSRSRRGYVRPSLDAYGYGSRTTAPTRTRTATFMGCRTRTAATGGHEMSAALSKIGAPTSSGNALAMRLGTLTTDVPGAETP